ncbi:type II toxin-antitoxin system HicB family antitoxin [Patescibacteria group bacterium]|nr:type II toxin-antitoxin system HicB family antitoxin [Patescibacteria group bacterium]MBU4338674.1 type II toxin-antitoxin system HicB family antitoxin [Patescibacteria group bacterium]MBU4580110.1 type II toxin-antitoxin system HicB family antitoxin [Patescibacteria group bacterium]
MADKTRKILSSFAVFDSAEEGGYNVSFPDFPGCVTFGKTFEEAEKNAKEVLELWLEELASQKQKIRVRTKGLIISEVRAALPQKTF